MTTNQIASGRWSEVKVGDVCEVLRGVAYAKSQTSDLPGDGYLPLLRSGNIRESLVVNEDLVYVPDELVKPNQRLRLGDVVVSTSNSRELVGKAAQLKAPWSGTFGAFCAVVRPGEEVRPGFIGAYLQSPAYRHAVGSLSAATNNIANLRKGHLEDLRLSLPPPEEQDVIVARIENLLDGISEGVADFSSAQRSLTSYSASVLNGLWDDQFPLVQLRDVLAEPPRNGRSVQTAAGGFPVLRLTAIQDGTIDTTQAKEGAWDKREAERYRIRSGDFLVARGNGSLRLVGRGGLVETEPQPVAYPDTMIRLRADESRMSSRFLRLIWASPSLRGQIESNARTSAGIYKINQEILGAIELPLPAPREQQRLAVRAEQQLASGRELQDTLRGQLTKAKQLKMAVLQREIERTRRAWVSS